MSFATDPNWRKDIHPGDEVTWNDPDDQLCSFTGTVAEIEYKEDNSAWIMFTDGHEVECLLSELS